MKSYIVKIKRKENLSQKEMEDVMSLIMSGEASSEEMGEFLLALNEKGPTIDEITAAARLLRRFSLEVKTKHPVVLDTCGTGGDKKNTFNISTVVAFVVAGCGVVVAKHGNRSVSSRCGSADILEALGVNLNLDHLQLGRCLDEIGIAFLFAQRLHPAMKHVAPIRKALRVETIFNILGPLINPARATHQMIGVYHRDLVESLVQVLRNLGIHKALVVHGQDGLDEISTTAKTWVSEFDSRVVKSYEVDPLSLGFKPALLTDLSGGDLSYNTKITHDILNGIHGPQRDIVILNAAFALYTAEKVKDISEGITMASRSIDEGMAQQKLEDLKHFTNGLK